MSTEKKTLQTYLFSTVGVIVMAVALIAVNWIIAAINVRADLTEEKLYTLSKGTRSILQQVDTPVAIRFYFSKNIPQMPVYLKTYAQRVDDLLKEYRRYSGGHIEITRLNPQPDSDAEDSANLDGVNGQALDAFGMGGKMYFGLAISCIDQTIAIPFLSPDRESLLEYDITRAIYRVLNPEKPRLGVMSALPVMGQVQPNQMMMMQGNVSRTPPWQVISELKRDFDVVEVSTAAEVIDSDIDVLLLIHPKELAETTLFAIDQYVLRGGRLLAFLDSMSMVETQQQPNPQMQFSPPGSSTLDPLLSAWGITFETGKVVADLEYMTRIRRSQTSGPEAMPMVLSLPRKGINENDPATGQLDNVLYVFGGAFSGQPTGDLEKTILLSSSEDSQLADNFMAQRSGEAIIREFKSLDMSQALAIRLTGSFSTAFPNGKPAADDAGDDAAAADNDTGAGKSLLTSTAPSAVVLVGDADMIYDHFCVQTGNLFGSTFVQPINDNLNLVQNFVEQLSGDSNLISIRSRGAMQRPFEKVREKQAAAEKQYQDQIKALEDELMDVQRRINELQRERQAGNTREFITAEQREAIAKFRKKEAETNQTLKEVRKQLRRDVDRLENTLMVVNIGLMPVLVSVGGIALAWMKRRRMVRK